MKLISFLFAVLWGIEIHAQDSLSAKILSKYTHRFTLDKDELQGEGAKFLQNELKQNHFFYFGEYHGSKRTSEFFKAILPLAKSSGYDFFGLEVGYGAVQLLEKASINSDSVILNLRKLNTEYLIESNKRNYTPVPFFSGVSDAEFLAEAAALDFELVGLDQEFKFGLLALLDLMFDNCNDEQKRYLNQEFESARDTLALYYQMELNYYNKTSEDNKRFALLFHDSVFLNDFLEKVSSTNKENHRIAQSIEDSIEIYYQGNLRNYWKSNDLRSKSFVNNFRRGLTDENFDFSKDKMIIKTGGLHAAVGMNNYSMFDLGNTIYELSRFYGHSSVHLDALSRFTIDDDTLRDVMEESGSWYFKNFKELIQMGDQNEWTIIDLRSMKDDVFYQRKYLLQESTLNYFKRYDLVIIPPADEDLILNVNN
ncbi:MAG: hypothetical protein MK086_08000 [Flavobacteriales bacterium]|nr:hypothetical protein [Flavobacteriales bacterium]